MFIVCPIRRAQAPEESRDGGIVWHEKKCVATTRLKALSPALYNMPRLRRFSRAWHNAK